MRVVAMRVEGDSGETYTIDTASGGARCSCPAFRYGAVNWCKHLEYVSAALSAK